jgi:hypothetical protein
MGKGVWIVLILVVIVAAVGIPYFLLSSDIKCKEYYELKEATYEKEGSVWYRILHKGMGCRDPIPRDLLNSQFCYGADRLEYTYCQERGALEKFENKEVLCSDGNFFFLFEDKCENTGFCTSSNSCEYNEDDGICCAMVFFKDAYFKVGHANYQNPIRSSQISPYY